MLGAAVVGGVLSNYGSKLGEKYGELKEKNSMLQRQIEKLLKQIEAYHLLEDLYAKDLSRLDSQKAIKTIKTEYRNLVVDMHQCSRPEMTANEARKHLEGMK